MPKIPTLDDRRVGPRPLGGGQFQGVARGAGTEGAIQQQQLGQAVQQFGGAMGQIAMQQQDDRNKAATFAARTAFEQAVAEAQTAELSKTGMNAWGASQRLSDNYTAAASKHRANLENDEQRRQFDEFVESKRAPVFSRIRGHEAAEQRRAANDSMKASIQTTIDAGIADGTDDEVVALSIADIRQSVAAMADTNGWSAEIQEQQVQEHLTALHIGVIERRLEVDPDYAVDYFEANKDQIAGREHERLRKALEVGGNLKKAQTFADDIQARGLSEKEALAMARDQFEGEQEAEAVREVKARFADDLAAVNHDQQAAYLEADRIIFEGGKYDDIPRTLLARLSPEAREKLRSAEYGKKTDWGVYYGLQQLAAKDPATFGTMDLTQHFADLAPAERKEIIKLQTAAKGDPASLYSLRSKWQILQGAAAQAGLKPEEYNKKGDAGDRVRQLYQRIDDEARLLIAEKGRDPYPEELEAIASRNAIELTREIPNWFDEERAVGLAEVDGVPAVRLSELAAALEESGQPVTDENVRKLYDHLRATGDM